MRAVTCLAIGALLAPTFVPTAVAAQAQTPTDACGWAIRDEVQNRYPQARGVRILSSNASGVTRNDTRIDGSGAFEDRNGGDAKFDYGCTFNRRNGRTYDLDISNVRPSSKNKDNTAAIAGLVLGAIVVGALVAGSKDKDHDDSDDWRHDDMWSPADGVRCSSREAVCYKDGRYSRKWTDRVFVRR